MQTTISRTTIKPKTSVVSKESKVTSILNRKQSHKRFKDVWDRVWGSKKELAVYRKIELENLYTLESEDPIAAEKLVKKYMVIEKYDISKAKASWEDSWVVFLKNKIYSSLKNSPANDSKYREQYVTVVPLIWNDIKEAKTLDTIREIWRNIIRNVSYDSRWNRSYSGNYSYKWIDFIAENVTWVSFTNLLRRKNSQSAITNWNKAQKYNMSFSTENDWSWTETTRKVWTKTDKPVLHQYKKLDHIVRTWWREVTNEEISYENTLIEKFGYKSIQLGNYMDDSTSKVAIRNYIWAMKDLEDVLWLNITKMNRESGLSIAFGARWSWSALAHYEPWYNIINLTKSKWDWSIAHEWGHFLDYYLWKQRDGANITTTTKQISKYTKEPLFKNDSVVSIVNELMDYIKKTETKSIKKFEWENSTKIYPTIRRTYDRLWFESTVEYISKYNKNPDIKHYAEYLSKISDRPVEIEVNITGTKFYNDALELGKKYWASDTELFARAFASFIDDSLEENWIVNNYLVSDTKDSEKNYHVHPLWEERIKIHSILWKLIKEIAWS